MTWKATFLTVLWLTATPAAAQKAQQGLPKRLWNTFFNDTTDAAEKSFRIYPTLGYSPETGVELGASSLWLFRAKNDTLNRLSEVQAFTFVTLKAQYGVWVDNAIYGDKDKWFFLGRTRIQRFPLLYYGIGHETSAYNPAVLDANYILLRQRVLRKVMKNLFFGPEIDYQQLFQVQFNQPHEGEPHQPPTGSDGTTNLGAGLALVYDTRHNVLNVRKGLFGELSFLNYRTALGSEHHFSSINLDIRSFHPVRKNNVLAWQIYGNFLQGEVPFNQMALMGGDMMMRGYYQGRYRDKNLLSAQVEYRMLPFSFSKRWGATVFAGVAGVAPEVKQFQLRNTKLAAGVGLRYLLFPKKDIYLRFDLGFTQDGPGFYFFTGEAF